MERILEADIFDELEDEASAAALARQTPRTLTVWRCEGKGPAYVKIGRKVFYRRSDIRKWLEAQTVRPEAGR